MTAIGAAEDLRAALDRAARWLPHQGPLGVFVHHNTLEAFEELDFHEALDAAHRELGARVRLAEPELRAMLADGRIDEADLSAAFDAELVDEAADASAGLPAPRALAWTLLRHGLVETHWRLRAFRVAEGGPDPVVLGLDPRVRARLADEARGAFAADPARAVELLTGTRDLALSRRRLREQHALADAREACATCMDDDRRAAELGFGMLTGLARAGLPALARQDPDLDAEALHRAVDELVLPAVAAFLDRGQACAGPDRRAGLLDVGRDPIRRRPDLARAARGLLAGDARATLAAALDALGAPRGAIEPTLRRVLLVRRGWAGAVAWREHHEAGGHGPSLVDYAALRLVATIAVARSTGVDPAGLFAPAAPPRPGIGTRADAIAQLLARAGVGPARAEALEGAAWEGLEALLHRFDAAWRCRVLQEAREATHRRVWLSALGARRVPAAPPSPRAQVLCCIDDREESFRRALEEAGGDALETFGLAGHFGLALRWRGVDDVHPSARHPVLVPSTHRVEERALAAPSPARKVVAAVGAWIDRALDPLSGAMAGLLAGVPSLVATAGRTLWPARAHAAERSARRRWLARPRAHLLALREEEPAPGALPLGLTADEAAERIGLALATIGLRRFGRLVVVLGHRSTSRNNPFASAYECGACGGSPGDQNARTFAVLANDPGVRERLAARGVPIPPEVRFVGGVHDTSTDEVDLWPGPEVAAEDVAWLRDVADRAAAQDARERSRRFLARGDEETRAVAAVAERSADLSEVRPEYCHATNAAFVVGPRSATRGLFLDRRALLHSYDADADPDGGALERVLGAAGPVCAGINLEYYFSRVDNERFGAGTKLPHNVVGLHGLMNGSLGDLRTGLPLQTVEIHEPTRLLLVVFAPRARVADVVARVPAVARLVHHRWIQLAVVDAEGTWCRERQGFVRARLDPDGPPDAAGSVAVFRGRHDALPPTRVAS